MPSSLSFSAEKFSAELCYRQCIYDEEEEESIKVEEEKNLRRQYWKLDDVRNQIKHLQTQIGSNEEQSSHPLTYLLHPSLSPTKLEEFLRKRHASVACISHAKKQLRDLDRDYIQRYIDKDNSMTLHYNFDKIDRLRALNQSNNSRNVQNASRESYYKLVYGDCDLLLRNRRNDTTT